MIGTNPYDNFLFRDLHAAIRIGTASDRYAGWIGQIYADGRYKSQPRSRKVGGKTFTEAVLPVESVREYFQHFPILEIDHTFYRLLLDIDLKPTQNYRVLEAYGKYLEKGDRLILKVPQVVCARRLWRGGKFVENPDYLNRLMPGLPKQFSSFVHRGSRRRIVKCQTS